LNRPETLRMNPEQVEPREIEQLVFRVNEFDKDTLLVKLIEEQDMSTVLIFTKTRMRADWVHKRLTAANVPAEQIHGDISQFQREKTLSRFRNGEVKVLVATDVAARGI